MKFSYRQILASAAGAVLAAVIASIFGVTGTIVGVAIGSIAATTGTAVVFQSIERTNRAVKQVVVHVPDNPVLRRLGGTNASGVTSSESTPASAVHEETASSAAATEATVGESRTSPGPVETSARQVSTSRPPGPPRTNLPWPQIVVVVVAVFVVSLLFVTVVELIAGRPLADLFGHTGGGTTVGNIVRDSDHDSAATHDDHHLDVVNRDDLVIDDHHLDRGGYHLIDRGRIDDHHLVDERLGHLDDDHHRVRATSL